MRLWHIDLIPYLPKSQLLAQWRELNSIFKKQDKHILINYVYDYDKTNLLSYTNKVISEILNRGYNIKSFDNLYNYFNIKNQNPPFYIFNYNDFLTFKEHDEEYLTICYYNLKEKYIRGQKDFTADVWKKLDEFYKKEMMKSE